MSADLSHILEAVAAGVSPRAAVGQELGSDLPHGWRDSEASGSRIKILYNPTHPSLYKGHMVRLDTQKGSWTYHERGALTGTGHGHTALMQHLHKVHGRFTESLGEVAPPGWSGTVKAMKKHGDIDNPFALAWWQKKHGAKSHIKPEKKDEARDNAKLDAVKARLDALLGPQSKAAKAAEPKKPPVDPGLKQRAMDWQKYNVAHPDETPEEKKQKIHDTFTRHGFTRVPWPTPPGVESFQHPQHPTHVVHYLSGPNRPAGAPDGAWYHHDDQHVAHNSGHDADALDIHLGQFFGTGPEHHQ